MTIDVSIIIPVHNRPALVVEAITSALDASSQLSIEVIVVDDASTDDTWEVLTLLGPRIVAIRLPSNVGQSEARNVGMRKARGDYLKFLDSDDLLTPGHLDEEVREAEATEADIVASGWVTERISGECVSSPAPAFHSIIDDLLAGLAVPTSGALYRRGRTACWDRALRKLDDWDFFVQSALRAESIVTIPGSAYSLRDHAGARATSVLMLVNAREHHAILRKIEARLSVEGKLTDGRKHRLAQYFYKELRVLSLFDRPAFEAAIEHIHLLDGQFRPVDEERQWWMRLAARLLGTRNAILVHSRAKRLLTLSTKRVGD